MVCIARVVVVLAMGLVRGCARVAWRELRCYGGYVCGVEVCVLEVGVAERG